VDVPALLEQVGERLSVRRAFGPAYEHGGVLVIPVALSIGGGGGGHQPGDSSTEGGGFGGVVHPLGVYVVRDDRVRFLPTYDATVLVMGVLSLLRALVRRQKGRG
jgi:uncharacterized spore protein YtfJ